MRFEDLKDTFFVVEATNFECLALWREWHKAIPMKQDSMGFVETIGEVNGKPVCICLTRYNIWDKWVVFYEATSIMVDHDMIRRWLDENVLRHCPKWNGGRIAHTDAMNFHHCVDALESATDNERDFDALSRNFV